MLNSTVEFTANNPDVNERAERYFAILRGGFKTALTGAVKAGTLRADFDVDQKVEILLGSALGLNIVIRSSENIAAGKAMAVSVANMVRDWSGPR